MTIPRMGKLALFNVMSRLGNSKITWRELLIRFALIFICLGLWRNGLNVYTFSLLSFAWVLDGGHCRYKQLLQEPLVQGILLFCFVLALGLLWGGYPEDDRIKWVKYFFLLNFIPFFSLLNEKKERVYWAAGALLIGAIFVFALGVYQWLMMDGLGVPLFKMSYLSFSAMLGISALLSFYFAEQCKKSWIRFLLWFLTLLFLFVQFNQNGRGLLLSTLIALFILILYMHKAHLKKLMLYCLLLSSIVLAYAYSSVSFQSRLSEMKRDFEHIQQGQYSTSIGYRIAMWDVGLHGIAERPLFGHGTGMPVSYFNEIVKTYKGGIYKGLPDFLGTAHYHNDWIEVGMHTGFLGMLALSFLYWSWYRTFTMGHFPALGWMIVCFIFFAGLSDAFLIFSRIPVLLIIITAIVICWGNTNRIARQARHDDVDESRGIKQDKQAADRLNTESHEVCQLCHAQGVALPYRVIDSLFGVPGEWGYKQCSHSSCELIWLDPMPAPQDIGRAYQNYYTHGLSLSVRQSKIARIVERLLHKPCIYALGLYHERNQYKRMFLDDVPKGRLLEVGCGDGKRLARMQALGWQVTGQEVDSAAAQYASANWGLDVHLGELQTLATEDKFDVIIMSHVIEHVYDPVALLSTCYQLLKPEGALVILTPNIASYGYQKFGANWRGLEPPRHLYLFTRATLIAAVQKAGFQNNKYWTTAVSAYGFGRDSFKSAQKAENQIHTIAVSDVLRGIFFQIVASFTFMQRKDSGEECVLMARK